MPTKAELLAEVPWFAELTPDDRALLADRLDEVNLAKGSVVFSHGDPGGTLYVVRKGEVELFFKNDEGHTIVFERCGPGDFFGELSLLDGGSRSSSALVTEDMHALLVDRGDLEELLRMSPSAALPVLAASGRRLRETTKLLRHSASRDINVEDEESRTMVMRAADWISAFSGSLPFLFLHLAFFAFWIAMNVGPLSHTRLGGWDEYPFGLLTMSVSLEAIFLSVFVLLSQNRQAAREHVRNDIEYHVNLKAELEVAHLHEKVDDLTERLLERLERIEGKTRLPTSSSTSSSTR